MSTTAEAPQFIGVNEIPVIDRLTYMRLMMEQQDAKEAAEKVAAEKKEILPSPFQRAIDLDNQLIAQYENGRTPGKTVSRTERMAGSIARSFNRQADEISSNFHNIYRVGRYAAGEVKHITPKKAAKFGKEATISYIKSLNPNRLRTGDRYFRYGYGIGAGMSFIFSATGLGFIPGNGLVRTGVGLGVIYGISKAVEVEYSIKKGSIEKTFKGDDLKIQEELVKLDDIKTSYRAQLKSAKDGLKMGGLHFGIGKLAEHFLGSSIQQLIEEGAKQADWARISAEATANNISNASGAFDQSVDNMVNQSAGEIGQTAANVAGMAPKVDFNLEKAIPSFNFDSEKALAAVQNSGQFVADKFHEFTAQKPEVIIIDPSKVGLTANSVVEHTAKVEYTPEGYALKTIEFPTVDINNNDLPSTKGLVEGFYRDIITQKDGFGAFDPKNHNLEYLQKIDLEISADPDYTKKLAAAANYYINYLNKDYSNAFSINNKTGVIGETFLRTAPDGQNIPFTNLDNAGWNKFFAGDWKQYYTPEAEKLVTNAPKTANWAHPTMPEDTIYKNLTQNDLAEAHFAKTDLNVSQLHSTKGLAEDMVSKQVEGHPGVDFGVEGPEKDQALIDAQLNPLHDLQVKSVEAQFNHDNPNAVVNLDSGAPTELFNGADIHKQPTPVNLLARHDAVTNTDIVDYSDMAKTLAPLVDEQSLKDGVVSSDFMQTYTLRDLVTDPQSLFNSIAPENAVNLRAFAEMIMAKEFGLDLETFRQKVAEDPTLAAKLEKAIAYFKLNNSSSLFDGENLRYRSSVTGNLYKFRLPNEEALKRLISLF